jgi:hexokinase
MGKGFAITSNLDLRKMLLDGYARHIIEPTSNENGDSENGHTKRRCLSRLPRIRLAAITNDTVATFASLAYAVKAAPNSRVAMGLIVGTGTNATVPMPLTSLHPDKVNQLPHPDSVSTVVINTEWTIRGTDAPLISLGLKTQWDLELNANSEAPGFQPFEYMTAGRYLGEIVRLVFVDLITREGAAEHLPPLLKTKNALATRFLSEVIAMTTDDRELATALSLKYPFDMSNSAGPPYHNVPQYAFWFWTKERAQLIRDIAFAVQQRSSVLIAAACVGLLDCVGDICIGRPGAEAAQNGVADGELQVEELVIAYAGGTISQYPLWVETCQRWIDTLVRHGSSANARKRVVLKEALDGGIVGAGVLAGMTDSIA